MQNRKYRIIEINNRFYPQEKKWYGWVYLDNSVPNYTWGETNIDQSECKTMKDAMFRIECRIKKLCKGKRVIHEFKQQDNGK